MKVSLEVRPMSEELLRRCLSVPDLTDTSNGVHAINLALDKIIAAVGDLNWPTCGVHRSDPIVSIEDNFDRLLFPKDNLSRSSVYSRYVSYTHMLRTHTSSMIPGLLDAGVSQDTGYICPGICYRRDVVDRKHCGEPHQVDVWRIKQGEPRLGRPELLELIHGVVNGLMPGIKYRYNEVIHPYTLRGLEVEVWHKGGLARGSRVRGGASRGALSVRSWQRVLGSGHGHRSRPHRDDAQGHR